MAKDLKDISCLVLDNGFFLCFAEALARQYGKVYYYTKPTNEYPKFKDTLTGLGIDNVERVNTIEEVRDEVDFIATPDVFYGSTIEGLRENNYLCWGGGLMEQLETNRLFLKQTLKSLKLPVNDFKPIEGIDKLREHLKNNDEQYIKTDYRGDFETWHHKTYKLSESFLDSLEHELTGAEIYPFMAESPIDAVEEVGIDTYIVDGQHPENVLVGVEIKDKSYAGYIKPYKELPETITQSLEKLLPLMKKGGYAQFYSSECRVTKDKESYLIDNTCRMGSPTGGSQIELIENLGEVIYKGAQGIFVEPKYSAKYSVELFISSHLAAKDKLPLFIPEEEKRWYKFRNLAKIKGTYKVVPHQTEMCELGTIVATGNSLDECLKTLEKRCKALEGFDIDYDMDAAKQAVKALEEAIEKKII